MWALCLTLLIGIGIARIVSTYHVFNHTIDEPSHLACGIEWWEKGTYTIETKHTPLARISVAFLPYMAGLRAPTTFHDWMETYPILSADGHYWRNLTLARIGVLPYFVICTLVVFFWTKRLYGAPAAIVAAAVLTFLPTILAHSSVATTDVAFTAMFCWSHVCVHVVAEEAGRKDRGVVWTHIGIVVVCKVLGSCVYPSLRCCDTGAVCPGWESQTGARCFGRSAISLLCAFLITWAVYRFSYAPLNQFTKVPDRVAAKVFGPSSGVTNAVRQITAKVPAPMPEIPDGIRYLKEQNQPGNTRLLVGPSERRRLLVLLHRGIGGEDTSRCAVAGGVGRRHGHLPDIFVTGVIGKVQLRWPAVLMIMIVTMPSRIDTGVRYVLPVYVFHQHARGGWLS